LPTILTYFSNISCARQPINESQSICSASCEIDQISGFRDFVFIGCFGVESYKHHGIFFKLLEWGTRSVTILKNYWTGRCNSFNLGHSFVQITTAHWRKKKKKKNWLASHRSSHWGWPFFGKWGGSATSNRLLGLVVIRIKILYHKW
jgi:hypothetical protein